MMAINELTQRRRMDPENDSPFHSSLLFQCFELVLPWLTLTELANVSLSSKTLYRISKSITNRRSSDASRSFENVPIPCINSVDHQLYPYFFYTPFQIPSSHYPQRQCWGGPTSAVAELNSVSLLGLESASLVEKSSGCGCDERCGDEVEFRCSCLRRFDGLEDVVVGECGPSCGCELECGNRLTQRGVSVRLKILKDRRKGWCLFSDQLIPKGAFICEYAGSSLTINKSLGYLLENIWN